MDDSGTSSSTMSVIDLTPIMENPSIPEKKWSPSKSFTSISSKSKSSKSRQSEDDSRYSKKYSSRISRSRQSEDDSRYSKKYSSKSGKASTKSTRSSKNRFSEAEEQNPYPSLATLSQSTKSVPQQSPGKSKKNKSNRASEDAGGVEANPFPGLISSDETRNSTMRQSMDNDNVDGNEEEDDTHYSRLEIKQCLAEIDAKVGKFYHPYDTQELQDLLSPIYNRSPKLLRRVLNYSLSGDSTAKTSDNFLWHAIEGHSPLDCVQVLLDYGIKVEFKAGVLGETPLMLCTEQLMYENVKVLLENGANSNARDDQGRNVLYYWLLKAKSWQLIARLRVLTLLIRHGADPSAFLQVTGVDKEGENENEGQEVARLTVCALEYAYDNDEEQIFEYLLRTDHLKHRHIIETLLSRAVQEDKKKYVEYIVKSRLLSVHNIPTLITYCGHDHSIPLKLIEKSKEIDHKISSQSNRPTPLIWATHYGYNDLVAALIKQGANLDLTDTEKNTACITATRAGNLIALQALIKNGCDCDKKNLSGDTALMISAAEQGGDVDFVKFLIRKGNVDLNATNLEGRNALYFAISLNHISVARVLIDKGINIPDIALPLAIEKGYNEVAKILINAGADLNNVNAVPPLQSAILNHNEDVAIAMIQSDASSDLTTDGGNSLLHYIASFGLLKTLRVLLDHRKSDVNITNGRGETPLMYALSCIASTRVEVVKTFLDAGANVNAKDNNGDSALVQCIRKDDLQLVELLVNNGADITVTDRSGDTLAVMAALRKNTAIIHFLLFKGLSQYDKEDSTFLISYIRKGYDDAAFMEKLYTEVPIIDLSLQSKLSYSTPLQVALQQGYIGIVRFLLKHDVHLFESKTVDLYAMIARENEEVKAEQREDIRKLLRGKNIIERSACSIQ